MRLAKPSLGLADAYREFRADPDFPLFTGCAKRDFVIRHGGLLSHYHDLYHHDTAVPLFFGYLSGCIEGRVSLSTSLDQPQRSYQT